MSTARSNGRLALLLAIGELQKAAGPDQRVTAPASLMDATASPGITGAWESWKPSPDGSNDYQSRKTTTQTTPELADGEFVAWLASGNPSSPADAKNPPGATGPTSANITLVADRTIGADTLRGTHLSPVIINQKGSLAWTVIDEGVKARINLPAEPNPAVTNERQARLRAPGRPQAEAISAATSALRLDSLTVPKVISLDQAELKIGKIGGLRSYFHDLTTHSTSLPVNVADGGFKADLTRAFEGATLPADFANRYVYSNTKTRLSEADPLFSTLAQYYQLYKKPVNPLQISLPNNYTAVPGAPDGLLIAPVVTRVSVVFSLVSRSSHGHWANTIPAQTGDPLRKNAVYLIYTPVITVYNPYSVPIQFSTLKVTFRNLPVAFKFFRNGVAQTQNHTLLSTFHVSSQTNNDWEDSFSCTASNIAGSVSGSTVTLYPGEARIFGENHAASAKWGNMVNFLWQNDLGSSKTRNVASGSGWDYRTGYIVDWLRPVIGVRTADNGTLGLIGVRPTDSVNVEIMPIMPAKSGGKFVVDIDAQVGSRTTAVGKYEYIYGSQSKLEEVLSAKGTSNSINFPFKREVDIPVSTMTLGSPDSTPISDWGSIPKQFAVFTLGARTSHDSLYPGKPGRTSSFVHHVLQMDATKSHPALLPMEMSLRPITGAGAGTVGSIDADDVDRAFHFSGTSRGTGVIQYVSQNIPTSPLLNLADLRHANLAGSGYLPLVQSTVGESLASPVVPGDKTGDSTAFGYQALDHAWLANQTLWDGFHFSGIRNQSDADLLFNNQPQTLNPRQTPMLGSGVTASVAAQKALSDTAWADLASSIAIKGGFNVNSTSKSAWKAVLSSLRGLEVPVLGPPQININPASDQETVKVTTASAFPRLSRPIGGSVDPSNSSNNQLRWSGFRELTDSEVDSLAAAIVAQVRTRGPFLSMAEFVNRRLAASTDEMAARGALEEAILKSKINEIPMGQVSRAISEAEAKGFGYANPKAAAGNTEEGASAILSQGDLLSAIGASITVRSDTFVIRAYGDAREGSRITARAWCEAVVQRIPAFVDPADMPEKVQPAILSPGRSVSDLSPINRRFGRRFEIISLRWLTAGEL